MGGGVWSNGGEVCVKGFREWFCVGLVVYGVGDGGVLIGRFIGFFVYGFVLNLVFFCIWLYIFGFV